VTTIENFKYLKKNKLSMPEIQETLKKLGLEPQKAKTYLALLDLGETTAIKLAERTHLGRVHTYQIINKLIGKGLASYIIKNNVKYFSAADPETLLKDLQEKEENLKKILPELKARQKAVKPETKVEIYRSRKGINSILKLILKSKTPYYIMGGAQEACTIFELENKIFVKQAEKTNLKGYILARKEDYFFVGKNEEFRYIPEHLISTTTMMLWNNKTAIFVWSEPYYVVLIENKEITKSNLTHFNYLWSIAKKPAKEDREKRLLP